MVNSGEVAQSLAMLGSIKPGYMLAELKAAIEPNFSSVAARLQLGRAQPLNL